MSRSNHLAKFFRQKRIERGLTQIDLSRILGYSTSQFVSNWERGLCSPPLAALPKLCEVLKISKTEIVDILTTEYRKGVEKAIFPSRRSKTKQIV